eukprot:m.66206 g.66206  ORF g.66206 m.66206 type:complete len:105 (+) comp14044_c0_seq4:2177-2491(+)
MSNLIVVWLVAYVDEWTAAFGKTLLALFHFFELKNKPCTCYLTVEKRINFSEDRLEVCSPTYEALQRHCLDLSELNVRRLELGFSQWTAYPRTNELELLELKLS